MKGFVKREPTAQQCSNAEMVYDDGRTVGYALWYPQMGGYAGRAVVCLDKEWREGPHGEREGGCIDVLVWHDGEFPLSDGETPARLHHCDPEQFIKFGQIVKELNEKGKKR